MRLLSNNNTQNATRRLVATAIGTLLLGGCAIQPKAINPVEQSALATADLNDMFSDNPAVEQPISLYDAMARAIRFNLDSRVQLMEEALRIGELDVAKGDLLPRLTVSAGYNARTNYAGSSSMSLLDGTQSLVPSTSQEKQYHTADASFTWNILDFGVSYAQARQQADRVLIAGEQRRKVVQNIIQDVRYAYWRAVSASTLLPEMDAVLEQAEQALQRVDTLQLLSIEPPLQYLEYRKKLLTLVRDLWALREQLATARAEFAALINLRPGQEYQLLDEGSIWQTVPSIDLPVERLEGYALIHRPDIREEHYNARVSAQEIRKAMARMLPGVELSLGRHYDSNQFLFNDSWSQLGLRVSWNIFNLFTGQKAVEAAEALHELDNARRRSLQMAVLVQVHLAMQRFTVARKNYLLAEELSRVEQAILKQTEASEQAQMQNELEVLRARVAGLLAAMTRDISYAELQNAYGRIKNSIGIDPLPDSIEDDDLGYLARQIEEREDAWQGLLLKGG